MPRQFRPGPDAVVTAVVAQVGLIVAGFGAIFAVKIGLLVVKVVLLPFHF